MAAGRKALLVATYDYRDPGLRRLTAPAHDVDALAEVLRDPGIAAFDVTTLLNEPAHVVGEAIADFYRDCRRDDLALVYFSGHGVKDDDGRLYLAMANTRRDALLFTGLSAAQISDAMDACISRRKVLVLDCCYSGAFPAGSTAKGDESVHTLERFQGKGRAVLTASDSTQYSFEGDTVVGSAGRSLFTQFLVEAIRTGEADLDADGDIALDELYSYVHDRVVAAMPQQRPKKQEDVDGRIILARNVHWTLPSHLRYAIDSPLPAQRLAAVDELAHLHRVGNDVVRAAVARELAVLAGDDSRAVSAAAGAVSGTLVGGAPSPAVPAPRAAPEPVPAGVPSGPENAEPAGPARAAVPPARETPSRGSVAVDPGRAEVAGAPDRARAALLVALVAVAGGLLTASRFMVFEAANGYHAVDLGWSTPNFVVQVVLPLAVAIVLLLAGRGTSVPTTTACGVLAGVVLALLSQLAMSALLVSAGGVGYRPGPAWWPIAGAALVLAAAAVAGPRGQPQPHTRLWLRDRLRRNGRAVGGASVVVVSVAGWLVTGPVSVDTGWWLYLRVPVLVLAAACLCLTGLRLSAAQRRFSLAAVATLGAWLAEMAMEGLAAQPGGARPSALLVSLLAVLLWLCAAFVVQSRAGTDERGSLPTG